jgi:hypothetical protein
MSDLWLWGLDAGSVEKLAQWTVACGLSDIFRGPFSGNFEISS